MSDYALIVAGGHRYRFIGLGFGAQLESFEWLRPPAGTRRRVAGHDFGIFHTERRGVLVRCSWGVCFMGDIDSTNEKLRAVKQSLRELF